MNKLEGPLLNIKTHKTNPDNWMSKGLGGTSRVLTVAMEGEEPFFPKNVAYTSWEYFKDNKTIDIKSPDSNYDVVYLTNVLDRFSSDDRSKVISEAGRVTKNGGLIVALSPACNDAEEAYELATNYGLDTTEILSRRLSNRDIARLRPQDAAFFQSTVMINNRDRLIKVMNDLGVAATLEHLWGVKTGNNARFAIKRLRVGMKWQVERS